MGFAQSRGVVDILRKAPHRARRWPWVTLGVVLVAGATVLVGRLEPAAPSVARSSVFVAAVERGELVREVKAPGTLVPRQVRWVTAVHAGRVERILVDRGDTVDRTAVVVELSNPELELQALQAADAEAGARASLIELRTGLQTTVLAQESALAAVAGELKTAERTHQGNDVLLAAASIAADDVDASGERLDELQTRHRLESRRLAGMKDGGQSQLGAQRDRIASLAVVADHRRAQLAALRVVAGGDGVVQDVAVEPGQWVQAGDVLAKIADPHDLEAHLQVAQVQATDIAAGQSVSIDTRAGVVAGVVARVAPAVAEGSVVVEVDLSGALPKAARPDLTVEGTVELVRIPDTVFVRRPVHAQPDAAMQLFVLDADGEHAQRHHVTFGRGSATTIEVLQGAKAGDTLVVSDMAAWAQYERIALR